MIGLQGARVLLIDDTLREAIPVIKACSKKNIPVAYFDGTIDDLPNESEKFTQIRLVIADMDIIGGGDTDDNKISALIARLQRIMAFTNGPYTLVAWTKHPDLISLLDRKLFDLYKQKDEKNRVPLPVIIIQLEKKDYENASGIFDIEKLNSRIESELNHILPLSIMQYWEENCSFSASGVTNDLSRLAEPNVEKPNDWREHWKENFRSILISLTKEEIGKDNLQIETFYEALLGVLNPLHQDISESIKITCPSITDEFITSPIVKIDQIEGKINTKLHLSIQETDHYHPGNLYKIADCTKYFSVDPKLLFECLVQKDHKTDQELYSRITPILLEVSASCDFAQKKIVVVKLLGGLLIDKKDEGLFKQPCYKQPLEAILSINPIWLDENERKILLSSQYLLTVDKKLMDNIYSFARLRNQWLTNVQIWLSQQLSRQGVVMLE